MPQSLRNVKCKFVRWIDTHPRTGWYVAVMVTLNLVVSIVGLFS